MKFNNFLKICLILCLTTLFIQCKKSNNNYEEEQEESYSDENGYSDGTYCAEIDYYYSETGTSSTYTLLVEIENNELTVIHWPNGGWLDDSHFTPPDISSGEASFSSDRGVDYTVKIIGNEGDCSTSSYVTDEDDLIQQKEDDENEEYRKKQLEEEEEKEAEEEKRRQEEEESKE
ncbi:hypothetical protein FCOL_12335 [Flavobacterium columnare ATCC 49512]|uniref:Uncharacterized protein n=1 Tax=Flavobacterium columnare (strain ATCC 49512 / CIP 103533 / TG 44/87) TaxID=1041826 RepID=G8X9R8_FLACA|nr:hypothetical protein [Flavobacterium columnare]AEW87266.1 hypothetical protein FCOL_12335 [Flavobacterium columnare ATCC 49512]